MIKQKTADKILTEIKKSKNILLALHVSPDGDAFSSVLSLDLVLRGMKKKTKIISYSAWNKKYNILPGVENIEIADFAKINLSEFDLFIALDTAQETMLTRSPFPQKFPRNFKIINIDHHITNTKYGKINLIEPVSSVAEVLYELFNIWKVKIGKTLAHVLLMGIFTDTGCFQYPYTTSRTMTIAADLMGKGASLNEMVLLYFRSYPVNTLKYWGRVLDNMKLDESGLFAWSIIGLEEKELLGIANSEIEGAASLFAPIINGTEFGIILDEEGALVRGSMRSRKDFDVSKIAEELGGGGHRGAAGFSLKMSLPEAEKKVLAVARKFLKL